MTDLAKSVLGGARSLIVGWILPAFLGLQLLAATPALSALLVTMLLTLLVVVVGA